MTDYATDERSVALRKRQGIDEMQIKTNAIKEIVNCAKLTTKDLLAFELDCLPVSPSEQETSMQTRLEIIDYILSLEPIRMANLTVAKTEHLLAIDNEKIKEYEGAITGYKERLQEVKKEAKNAVDRVHETEKKVAELNKEIKLLKLELVEKDTDELVTTATWLVNAKWQVLRTQDKEYKLTSQWPIQNVRRWTNGKCTFEDTQTKHELQGKIVGQFMRGLYASIALETRKREKYKEKIKELKDELEKKERERGEIEKDLCKYIDDDQHKGYREEIDQFKNFVKEQRKSIIKHSNKKMTIDEANTRALEEFK